MVNVVIGSAREGRAVKRMLVATDGSPGANAAVDAAIDFAGQTGSLLTVVCIRQLPEHLGTPLYERAVSNELRQGRAVIENAAVRARRAGVEVESEILTGQPAEEIVRLATSRDVDLIVVGSHGRGRVATAFLGSVASQIVHTADRPVLVVKESVAEQRKAA